MIFICSLITHVTWSQNSKIDEIQARLDTATTVMSKARLTDTLSELFLYKNPEKSKSLAEQCLRFSKSIGFKIGIASAYNHLGSFYFNEADYLSALDFYFQSLDVIEEEGNEKFAAGVHNNIAQVNMRIGRLDDAQKHIEKSIELREDLSQIVGLSITYQTLASIHYMKQNYEAALDNFYLSAELAQETGELNIIAASSNGIGAIELQNENYEAALEAFKDALDALMKSEDYSKGICGVYHNMAIVYFRMEEYDEAINLLKESLEIAKRIDSQDDIKKAYSKLNECYREKGDLANALIALEYYTAYKDSVLDENVLKEINALQEKYNAKERESTIRELDQDNAALREKSSLQLTVIVLGIFIILVLVVFLLLYLKYKKAVNKQKYIALEQKALRSQMNPHFIFNSLNSIQRLYVEGKEDLANDYMADFSTLLRQILENSGMDRISLKEELRSTQLYLDLEKMRTNDLFDYSIEIDPSIDQLNCYVPPLVLQPYVENAIWHGIVPKNSKGKIEIRLFKLTDGSLECEIDDDGVGFSASKSVENTERKSKAMSITKDRLGGDKNVEVQERKSGGTRIKLRIQPKI